MKWDNLKKNKCPACNKDWAVPGNMQHHTDHKMIECKCGYKISEARMTELVNEKVGKNLDEEQNASVKQRG